MTLYTDPKYFQMLKLLVAAEISKIPVEYTEDTPDSQGSTIEDHSEQYISGPKLLGFEVLPQKFKCSENATARFLLSRVVTEDNELAVDHWLDWENACLSPSVFPYLQSRVGQSKEEELYTQHVKSHLKHLDTELKGEQFVSGSQLTAADVAIWATLFPAFSGELAIKGCDSEFPAVQTWFSALTSKSEFKMAAHTVFKGGDSTALKPSQPSLWRHKETDKKPAVQKHASKQKEETAAPAEKDITSPAEMTAAAEALLQQPMMSEDSDFSYNLSQKLSEVLSDIGVNERIVQKRRRLMLLEAEIFRKVDLKLNNDIPITDVYNFGSQSERSTTDGLRSDMDVLYCFDNFIIIQEYSEWQRNTTPGKYTLLMIRNETTYPGYCLLQRLRSDAPLPDTEEISGQENSCFTNEQGRFLLKNTSFRDMDVAQSAGEKNGPAITRKQCPRFVGIDNVVAFKCKSWPVEAQPWLEKVGVSKWPSEEMKKSCVESGCLVVPIGSKSSQNEELEWRISFSQAERYLMFSLNITQIRCYILMKMILKTFINPKCQDVISSYMCKNILFHFIQNTYSNTWNENNLFQCFRQCLLKLQKCILKENCPQFMIAGNNLMAGRISSSNKQKLAEILENILQSEGRALLEISIDDVGWRLQLKMSQIPDRSLFGLPYLFCPGRLVYEMARCLICHYRMRLQSFVDSTSCFEQARFKLLNYIDVLNREMDQHGEHSMEYAAYKLFVSFLNSTLGSLIASVDIYKNKTLSPEAMRHLTAGFDTDVSSGRLKYASALYCTGDMEATEHVLKSIEDNYNLEIVEPACGCLEQNGHCDFRQGFTSIETGDKDFGSKITAFCVCFILGEMNCVPEELHYEMQRSSEEERLHRDQTDFWMDWMVVDSLPYLYFLQYKTYSNLKRPEEKQEALRKLVTTIDKEPNFGHHETSMNLLGRCMLQECRFEHAQHCFARSLMIRPRNNAAKKHIKVCEALNIIMEIITWKEPVVSNHKTCVII